MSKNALLGLATEAPFPLFFVHFSFTENRFQPSLKQTVNFVCGKEEREEREGQGRAGSRGRGAASRHCEKGPF